MNTPTERVEAETEPLDKAVAFANKACVCTHAGIISLAQPLYTELSQAQATIKELQSWKSQMLQVWSQIDDQKIAAMLGAGLGESTFEVINRRVPEVLEELKEAQTRVVELEGIQKELIHALNKSESGAAVMRKALKEHFGRMERRYIQAELEGHPWSEERREPLYRETKSALSTDAGKSMVPRAVLVECRDALKKLLAMAYQEERDRSGDPTRAESFACVTTIKPALKSANLALGGEE